MIAEIEEVVCNISSVMKNPLFDVFDYGGTKILR